MKYRFTNPEWFADVESVTLNEKDKIFLWGAGKVGTAVAHVLEQRGYKIIGFVDSDISKTGTMLYGYRVYSPEEYYILEEDVVTIVSCAFPSVITMLEEKGIKAYSPHSLLLEVDFEGYRGALNPEFVARLVDNAVRNYAMFYKKNKFLDRLLVSVTEQCTLKCKNCDAYIPFHHHPRMFSYEDIIKSYNTILDVCEYIESIDLLGGEPLLHPDLDRIVDYLVSDVRCGNISIISNGTIVPNEKLIKSLKNKKCLFRISDYGTLSKKKKEIIDLLEREQINYEITNYQYWDEIPRIGETNENREQLDLKFATCTANALYLKGNVAFYCTFLSGLHGIESDLEILPSYEKNIVYLDRGEETLEKLQHYIDNLHERKAIDACRFCPGAHCIQFGERVSVAEQTEKYLPVSQLYCNGKGL